MSATVGFRVDTDPLRDIDLVSPIYCFSDGKRGESGDTNISNIPL